MHTEFTPVFVIDITMALMISSVLFGFAQSDAGELIAS